MRVFLLHAPVEIDAAHVVDGEDPHGHAEVVEGAIDLGRCGAFFDEELRFAHIREHHAVADEAHRVAYEHADFAQSLRKRHSCRDDTLAGGFAPHDFNEAHDVRGAEEVGADHHLGSGCRGGDFVDVESRRVGREDAVGLRDFVYFGEQGFLDGHAFESGFDDDVGFFKAGVIELGMDQGHAMVHDFLREAAFGDGVRIILADDAEAAVERFLRGVFDADVDARVGERHRNTAAHGACANDAGLAERVGLGIFWNVWHLGNGALGDESVDEGAGLFRGE